MARFNTAEFRACAEPLEELFFADRNTFYQGLLHLVVALLQLQRGMIRGPRIRLGSAVKLLTPYAPCQRGADVAGLLRSVNASRVRLPEELVAMAPEEVHALGLPVFQLEVRGRWDDGGRYGAR